MKTYLLRSKNGVDITISIWDNGVFTVYVGQYIVGASNTWWYDTKRQSFSALYKQARVTQRLVEKKRDVS